MAAFLCPSCGTTISLPGGDAGRKGTCPSCRQPFFVPQDTKAEPTRAASESARQRDLPDELAREVERARAEPQRRFGPFILLDAPGTKLTGMLPGTGPPRELGKGGMGIVYRAWNDRLRRVVALKLLLQGEGIPAATVGRFKREAEAAARLRHPNIVSVHEAGEQDGKHYIAMDYIPGRTLDQRLEGPERERLPLSRAVEVILDVARAVHHAHEQGVVHRDLKPQNVLLDANDHPYVLDFGLASLKGSETKLTKTGTRLGTPAYMPPEQAGGEATDERSDVYSLGATLYHVLTRRPPFGGTNEVNLIMAVLTKDPVPPSAFERRAAGDLETICLKCLEKEPDRRYWSARALALDLERFLAGEPISAKPLGRFARLARRARRNKLVSVTVVLASLLVASVVTTLVYKARMEAQAEADREAAVLAERARQRDDAREKSKAAWEKLEALRASLSPQEAPKRADDLVLRGLDALQAAVRFAAAAPDDADAKAKASRAAFALGDIALDAEQWSVARAGYGEALRLGVESARATKALDEVSVRRRRIEEAHAKTVEKIVGQVMSGDSAYDHDDALFGLVRLGEAQTVRLLSVELETSSRLLLEAKRELLEQAREPTPDEARAGIARIEGLADAIGRVFALAPGESLDPASDRALEAARKLLEDREARGLPPGAPRPTFSRIAGARGAEKLGARRIELTKLACEALGRIGMREAIPALSRYLDSEPDEARAIPAGIALCELDCDEAERVVRACPFFRVRTSVFRKRAERALSRLPERAGTEPRTVDEWKERASRRFLHGDGRGAVSDLTRAIELDGSSVPLWLERGFVKFDGGDLDGGVDDFTHAVELDGGSAEALTWRGIARTRRGDLDLAIADCSQAIDHAPRLAIAWGSRGGARFRKHDLPGAQSDYGRAIELDPGQPSFLQGRALVRMELGDLAGALADMSRAVDLDAEDGEIRFVKGHVEWRKDDLDSALRDFSRAIELAPHDANAWAFRSRVRARKGDLEGAIADLAHALELVPKVGALWQELGSLRFQKGDTKGAIAAITHSLEIDPGDARALANRGMMRSREGDQEGALADLDHAVELAPSSAAMLASRAFVKIARGDLAGAVTDATRALGIDPRSVIAWNNRACARMKQGDLAGAIEDSSRALDLDATRPSVFCTRAEARTKKGELDLALADLARAIDLDPHDPEPLRLRGDVRLAQGDLRTAIADYSKGLEVDPRDSQSWMKRGFAREKAGEKDAAALDFERFLELSPSGPDADAVRTALSRIRGP